MNKKRLCLSLIFIGTILSILSLFVLMFSYFTEKEVYAATTEKEELISLLNTYKDQMGDLQELKKVVDKTYNDINSATTVNNELKQTLNDDISQLSNVPNINLLIVSVLQTELKTQINNMTNDNINEFKEEIAIIKEWVDEQVGSSNKPDDNPGNTDTPNSGSQTGNSGSQNPGSQTGNSGSQNPGSQTGNSGSQNPDSQTGNSGSQNPSSQTGNSGSQNSSSNVTHLPNTGMGNVKFYVLIVILLLSIIMSGIGYKYYFNI